MNRQQFLALAFSPLLIRNTKFSKFDNLKMGLQLYTLRNLVNDNLSKTLGSVAKAAYTNLELYPLAQGNFFGLEPATCKKMLADVGLKSPSIHIPFKSDFDKVAARTASFSDGFEALLDGTNIIGAKYVVLPNLPGEFRKTADDYKKMADLMNKAGEAAKTKGLVFGYHNHSFEFNALPNSSENGYDILLKNTDASLVKFELDIYWFLKAKQDIKALFDKHPNRFPLWHVKDIGPLPNQETYPVGKGSIDWKHMLTLASKAGLDYAFVEQDNHAVGEPIENVTGSLSYLNEIAK